MTKEEFQATTAVQLWIETMRKLSDDGNCAARAGFSRPDAGIFIGDLIHAARRTGLRERIMASLGEVNYSRSARAQSAPAGLVCAEEINRFVETLGQNAVAEADRPEVELEDGSRRAVFARKPFRFDASSLPAEPVSHAEEYGDDWTFAVYDMFEKNVLHGDDGTLNVVQNVRLGAILSGLRSRGEC